MAEIFLLIVINQKEQSFRFMLSKMLVIIKIDQKILLLIIFVLLQKKETVLTIVAQKRESI
jgi:hypothetical protein